MALDYGTRRVGVALSDPLRLIASPLCVLDAATAIDDIRRLADEYRPDLIVVGLPVSLSGREGASAAEARALGAAVAEATGLQVEFVDERYSTSGAERALLEANVKRRDRRTKVDKVAAALILQHFLDRRS
jgi:putative holliday junction resolvase